MEVRLADGPVIRGRAVPAGDDPAVLLVTLDGVTRRYLRARDGDTLWLGTGGATWTVSRHVVGDPRDRARGGAEDDGVIRSPMPGTVLVVKAAAGDEVDQGQTLLVVEAMKMEHAVSAPVAGVLAELRVRPGQSVAMDAVLAVLTVARPSGTDRRPSS
jgi:acetyl-CoA/propionyl-CoA carboxylase biotin carboxyl carrier protein